MSRKFEVFHDDEDCERASGLCERAIDSTPRLGGCRWNSACRYPGAGAVPGAVPADPEVWVAPWIRTRE